MGVVSGTDLAHVRNAVLFAAICSHFCLYHTYAIQSLNVLE